MRDRLSQLLVEAAGTDESFLVLSGDHGYALFDALRAALPEQFVNVGVAEQSMIGVAAGLSKVGFHPCVYGLSAFVPMRVLEQIKLDLCHASAPVILLGDGAGLVYSTLGVSHQCGEDIACLRSIPNIAIYSPCDEFELAACWRKARVSPQPSYIRLGKADRPPVHSTDLASTDPCYTHGRLGMHAPLVIVATGSMVSLCTAFARENNVPCISIPQIHPFPDALAAMLPREVHVAVAEEHCTHGGLFTAVVEMLYRLDGHCLSRYVHSLALRPAFTRTSGSWQQALSEHDLSDNSVRRTLLRLKAYATATGGSAGRSAQV